MRHGFATAVVLLFVGRAQADGPLPLSEVIKIVHADLARIPLVDRPHFRYLDSHYEPSKKAREKHVRTLSGHVNGLSREPDLVRLVVVDPDSFVLRLDLREYRLETKTYERLAEADPYYHTKIVTEVETKEPWPGGVYKPENKYYERGAFTLVSTKKTVKTAIAPILTEGQSLSLMNDLVKWTGSTVPVLSAEWFFNQTAAAVDRDPNYYDFLGVKNEKDFQRLVGFDAKVAADFGLTELREAVADSTVTLQPRALRRDEKIGGGYWRSFDFNKAVDRRNPLRVLGREIEAEFDASEQFGHLANGLWATGIFNKARERQAAAPGNIASDHQSKSTDKQVHVNISCLRCHDNGGMQDIDGWARNLFQPPLKLQSPDFAIQKKLRQQYVRRLEPFLDADRARYEAAVKEVTGWTSKEYSAALAEMWEETEDVKADLAWFAARLSVKPQTLKDALEASVKTGQLDLVLAAIFRGKSVKKLQAEEAFQLAYVVLQAYNGQK